MLAFGNSYFCFLLSESSQSTEWGHGSAGDDVAQGGVALGSLVVDAVAFSQVFDADDDVRRQSKK